MKALNTRIGLLLSDEVDEVSSLDRLLKLKLSEQLRRHVLVSTIAWNGYLRNSYSEYNQISGDRGGRRKEYAPPLYTLSLAALRSVGERRLLRKE